MDDSTWILTCVGAVAAVLAVIAWFADKFRHNRKDIERVGFMPWTGIFFWSLLIAVMALGLASKGWF